ncbi:MAG TPA: helix-turn-helix domain-containing protein [Gemmatimonadales bacterium]|nr:helix-turn-helix domain-containing protein [Gemmatimonadales bacterium]
MSTWNVHPQNTRGRIIGLLRRSPQTVEELATALGVTDNAVRAQLASLERDGMVRQHGLRRGSGKPSFSYALQSEFEPLLSKAYIPMLVRLLRGMGERLPAQQLNDLLNEVGQDWAGELPRVSGDLKSKVVAASNLLNDLGGVTEIEQEGRCLMIKGYSCPLALAVRENRGVCVAVQALLSRYIGENVIEHCDRDGERVHCRFEVSPP